jgi:hypothetical protein
MPLLVERVNAVRKYRQASHKAKTWELADYPTQFEVKTIPDNPFLAVPKVSSERREYLPIGWLQPPTLPSQLVEVILDADVADFGIITSRMHMTWLRYVGGRLKSDYQYSIGIVYNTFPWPDADEKAKAKICALAQAVLDARAAHQNATLADLYDPDVMPACVRRITHSIWPLTSSIVPRPFRVTESASNTSSASTKKLVAPLSAIAAAKTKAKRTTRRGIWSR